MSTPLLTWLFGLGLFAVSERYASGTSMHLPVAGVALLLLAAGLGLRLRGAGDEANPERQKALRASAGWMGLATSSVIVYLTTTDAFSAALGLVEETEAWWYVVGYSLGAVLTVLGLLPALFIDRALAHHPVALPHRARERAAQSGVLTALAVALFAPVNYLASSHDVDWDYAYFRTTRVGVSTGALVKSLSEPVEVVLFYSRSNEVLREMQPSYS